MDQIERQKVDDESISLACTLEDTLNRLHIVKNQRQPLLANLAIIDDFDRPTCNHSIRVGLKGAQVAEYTHIIPPNGLLYPGLLHDIGKTKIRSELVKKEVGWNEQDSKEMEDHVIYGFNILKDIHKFSAYVPLFHHRFHRGYPKDLPEWPKNFSESTRATIVYCGNLLAIIDSYDAASTRKNDKFSPGSPRLLTPNEVRTVLIRQNPGEQYLINKFYSAGIFR